MHPVNPAEQIVSLHKQKVDTPLRKVIEFLAEKIDKNVPEQETIAAMSPEAQEVVRRMHQGLAPNQLKAFIHFFTKLTKYQKQIGPFETEQAQLAKLEKTLAGLQIDSANLRIQSRSNEHNACEYTELPFLNNVKCYLLTLETNKGPLELSIVNRNRTAKVTKASSMHSIRVCNEPMNIYLHSTRNQSAFNQLRIMVESYINEHKSTITIQRSDDQETS